MTAITGILCQVITNDVEDAGTDGTVYLGIGGREFHLDSKEDDYERGSWREYILGRGPKEPDLPAPQIRVNDAEYNDPSKYLALDTDDLTRTPCYIRYEPDGWWNLLFAAALVYTGAGHFHSAFTPPSGLDNLWMGQEVGKILYLPNFFDGGERRDRLVLDMGRRKAIAAGIKDFYTDK